MPNTRSLKIIILLLSVVIAIPAMVAQQCSDSHLSSLKKRCQSKMDPRWITYCDSLVLLACNASSKPADTKMPLPQADEFVSSVAPEIQQAGLVDQLVQYQTERLDKQSGNNTTSSGSTSLVSKPGIPMLVGFAVESGALVQSSNGTSTTVQGNVGSLYKLLTGRSTLCSNLLECNSIPVLSQFAVTGTFNISQNGTSTVPISGSGNTSLPAGSSVSFPNSHTQLQTFSARYQIWNKFDPHSDAFKRAFFASLKGGANANELQSKLDSARSKIAAARDKVDASQLSSLENNSAFADCKKAANASDENVLDCLVSKAPDVGDRYVELLRSNSTDLDQTIVNYYQALAALQSIRRQAFDNAKGTPIFTFDYVFNRPPNELESHDVRLVFGRIVGVGMLIGNAAVSIYGGSIPANAAYGRLRNGQVSAQFDRPLASSATESYSALLSLAGYWQYQPSPSVLKITSQNLVPGTNIDLPGNATVLLGRAGNIGVGQVKLTIKFKNGAEIPIAGKWSSRPDLLTGNKWGGQFGLTYDLSAFRQLLGQ